MGAIGTLVIDFESAAPPEQVWAALTRPELTVRYLWGLAAESTWKTGAALRLSSSDPVHYVEGEVLLADPPRRLSYSLSAGETHPCTFVTWEVIPAAESGRVAVRVSVDETDASESLPREAASSWRSVVAGLSALLTSLPLA